MIHIQVSFRISFVVRRNTRNASEKLVDGFTTCSRIQVGKGGSHPLTIGNDLFFASEYTCSGIQVGEGGSHPLIIGNC
jgi:hypothetical protein